MNFGDLQPGDLFTFKPRIGMPWSDRNLYRKAPIRPITAPKRCSASVGSAQPGWRSLRSRPTRWHGCPREAVKQLLSPSPEGGIARAREPHYSTPPLNPTTRIDNMKINFLLFDEKIGRVVACMASFGAHWNMDDESPL